MRGLFVRSLVLASSLLAQTSYAKKTVQFALSLTWDNAAPDGFEKKIIKMNGQFPGPLLSVDEGDDVEFLVRNNLPNETTIHFHGMLQTTVYSPVASRLVLSLT
jgi:FtsP/CotA-like multicopper oxidase with cupredoxin domain